MIEGDDVTEGDVIGGDGGMEKTGWALGRKWRAFC